MSVQRVILTLTLPFFLLKNCFQHVVHVEQHLPPPDSLCLIIDPVDVSAMKPSCLQGSSNLICIYEGRR